MYGDAGQQSPDGTESAGLFPLRTGLYRLIGAALPAVFEKVGCSGRVSTGVNVNEKVRHTAHEDVSHLVKRISA